MTSGLWWWSHARGCRFLHLQSKSTHWNVRILIEIIKSKHTDWATSTVLMPCGGGGGGGWWWSHLGLLLDFEELGHVGKVFLVRFSHLLLCSLWVHNLQSLHTTLISVPTTVISRDLTPIITSVLPVGEWRLRWSWFLRSGPGPWTCLRKSCSASAAFADGYKRNRPESHLWNHSC